MAERKSAKREPRIVAFCCNWCAYAGADLAGVSRVQYAPNVEIIRTMCSGRLDPAFVVRAFRLGADGVMVAGCHEADCHYISGNQYAKRRVEELYDVLDLAGLGRDRLLLRWINANEGSLFAQTVDDFVDRLSKMSTSPLAGNGQAQPPSKRDFEELVEATGVLNCLECGKCTASCPVARRDPTFSPRRIIERALEDLADEVETDRLLWSCLTCEMCEQRCPSGVQFCDFVRGARAEARRIGSLGRASHTGVALDLMRIQGEKGLKQNRLRAYPEGLKMKTKATGKNDYLYFAGCAPYYQALYSELPVRVGEIPGDAVALLNAVGVRPVVLDNERCCGHDLLWNGDIEGFGNLVKLNARELSATGAGKIVTACPECYRTLKLDYPEHGKFDFEVYHISEVLEERLGKLDLKADKSKVTLQDPCRLGRHLGVYDAPRKLIEESGAELAEMARSRGDAICCGVSSWVSCGRCSKAVQVERLKEAVSTGAGRLISPCLKCSIHFNCALTGELPVPRKEVEIEIVDLTSFLAEAAGLKDGAGRTEKEASGAGKKAAATKKPAAKTSAKSGAAGKKASGAGGKKGSKTTVKGKSSSKGGER
ncbi:MAG: hydrogenase iron-sulfur subunit [Actinomycetota bacterium]|nr:hydrogenase iron-sulfur subunit [Actinomycetota bacterium]